MRLIDVNGCTQVVQAVQVAYSRDPLLGGSLAVPYDALGTEETIIAFISTMSAESLTVFALATTTSTLYVDIVAAAGKITKRSTTPLVANTAAKVKIDDGLGEYAIIKVAAAAPLVAGSVIVSAIARA